MKAKYILVTIRIAMALIFLWAFIDKLFGLGFATAPEKSWLAGVSPTTGFLSYATYGPFASIFKALAGVPLVDWLFMLGLLFVGLAFLFNKYVKSAAVVGMVMMLLMYLSMFPPKNNPIIDDHIIYLIIFAFYFSIHHKKHKFAQH